MANVKITALTNLAAADVADEDVFVIDDISVPESKKVTVANLKVAIDTIATSNINTVSSNVDTVSSNVGSVLTNLNSFASHANTNAAALAASISQADVDFGPQINSVQDNVVAAEANVVLNTTNLDSFASTSNSNATALATGIVTAAKAQFQADNGTIFDVNRTNGEKLNLEGGSGIETAGDAGGKKVTFNLSTTGNSGRYGGVDGTTLQIPQLVFDAFGRQISVANVSYSADFASVDANVDTVQDNVVAAEANVGLVRSNLDSFASTSNSNATALAAGIAGISVDLTVAADSGTNDVVVVGADTFTFAGGTGLTSTVSDNQIQFDIDDTAVTAGVYGGKIGVVSNVPVLTIDAQGRITSASNVEVAVDLSTLEGNVNTVSSNVSALDVQVNANLDAVQDNVTANFNQLDANIDVVQDNVAAIIDGTTNFTGEVTMNDDLIVTGNLTINGDQTTINTTNMEVDDTLIMLANGTTGAPANDIGILFNRGNQGNAAFFYDESAQTFKISDTLDPSSNTSLSPVTSANLDVGILTAATIKFDGADLNTAITDNVALLDTRSNAFDTYTQLNSNINVVSSNVDAVESRRTANIAGAISSVLTSDLTASRAVESDGSGKLSASSVTSTELGTLSGITASTAELNYNDITTLGTVQASKTVTADSSGEVLLPDDKAIKFGTGGDFTIKFDGTDTFLEGPSTGEVRIVTNQFQVFNKAGTQTMFRTDAGSITNLYSAGALRLQTTTDGIRIVGQMRSNNLLADGNITLGLNTSNTVTSRGTISAPAITLDGADLKSNLVALAAGVAGNLSGAFPTGDYGLLDAANNATDAFGEATADLDTFDMKTAPAGDLETQDLGALP